MIRISSFPSSEFCAASRSVGKDVEDMNALRSTVFHERCATGKWPVTLSRLPEEDSREIQRWHVPDIFQSSTLGRSLQYADAEKETRVSLGNSLEYAETPVGVTQEELADMPHVAASGTLDFCWDLPEHDLVVMGDIKSSIYAVSDGPDSLQLHGYGYAKCKQLGRSKYLPVIWDASAGKWHESSSTVDRGSLKWLDVEQRIISTIQNTGDKFTTGSHCRGCWKRQRCPAHLVDLPAENRFARLFSSECSYADVRKALVDARAMVDLADKAMNACKDWVRQNGPVPNEDGTKLYQIGMRAGRKSLDVERLLEASGFDRKDFEKQGPPMEYFDWRKAR